MARFTEQLGNLVTKLRHKDASAALLAETQKAAFRAAPPYIRSVEVYGSTVRLLTRFSVAGGILLSLIVGYQQYRIHELVQQVRAKDYLVIPGAADFVEVRANRIPDRVIIRFAEYFTTQLCSITDRNIESRFEALSEFMSPTLEARLHGELGSKAELLRSVKGAELFDQIGTPKIRRFKRNGKTLFEAQLQGRVSRYALGQQMNRTIEIVTLTFSTRSSIGAEEPWIFEVKDIVRRTEREQAEFERAQGIASNQTQKER